MDRRSLLLGFGSLLAAPAIVRAESIMKVAALRASIPISGTGTMSETVFLLESGLWSVKTWFTPTGATNLTLARAQHG